MKIFETRTYSVSDFVEWRDGKTLELSPKFQRRSVWKRKAKSYLIDTVLRGRPMPKIIIEQELRGSKNIRVVVDGQQRLRTILEFIDDGFKVSRAHNKEYANLKFSDLPKSVRDDFYTYNVGVDVIYSLPYVDLLDIFTRINSYTVSLNNQEKLNAKFVGYFKTHSYELGHRYAEFWSNAKILRDDQIARMAEAELASDLLIALLDRIQTSKSIPNFYRDFEDKSEGLDAAAKSFDRIMSLIGDVYSDKELAGTSWRRLPLFYSLFTVLGHKLINGIPFRSTV